MQLETMISSALQTILQQWSVVYDRFVLKNSDAPYRVIHYEVPHAMGEHFATFINVRPELLAVAALTTLVMCTVMVTMHLVFSAFSTRYAKKFTFAERVECVERVASTLHASVVFLISLTTLLLDSALPHDPILGTPSPYYLGLQFAISCGSVSDQCLFRFAFSFFTLGCFVLAEFSQQTVSYFTSDALVLLFSRIPQWEPVVVHHILVTNNTIEFEPIVFATLAYRHCFYCTRQFGVALASWFGSLL